METILIIILAVVVIALWLKRTDAGPKYLFETLNNLVGEIVVLKNEISELKTLIQENRRNEKADKVSEQSNERWMPPTAKPAAPAAPPPEPKGVPASGSSIYIVDNNPEEGKPKPKPQPINVQKEETIPSSKPDTATPEFEKTLYTPQEYLAKRGYAVDTPPEPAENWIDIWVRNNPDLEKFIGENLINKIGIAVLVLGIAFFVKYAIDNNWINEVGRVCIGLGCGALLVGLAHFMRNSYRSFSSVLAGGGIAVFYFTIAFSFHQYHLMTQTAAFVIMVVITAFAIALSVLYNKLELAIIATIGGFLTPFLLSTGEGNYVILFTYLIILNIGVLTLAYFKRWPSINAIALFFTEIIFAGWMITTLGVTGKVISYPVALSFATAFYLIFLGTNMIHQMKNSARFKPFDFGILLLISSSYFAAGLVFLHYWNGGAYQGIFTLALGFVNLLLAYYVFKSGRTDRNLLFLLIGITLTFITLTIPIQLRGHAITMFWSVEFVLLFWLSRYFGIRVFQVSSVIVCGLAIVSLLLNWSYNSALPSGGLPVIFLNLEGIVTNLVAISSFYTWAYLLQRHKDDKFIGLSNTFVCSVAFIIGTGLLYLTCYYGINLAFHTHTNAVIPNVYHLMITNIFAFVFILLCQKKLIEVSPWLPIGAIAVCFLAYIGSTTLISELRNDVLNSQTAAIHLWAHWVNSLLNIALFYITIQGIRKNYHLFKGAAIGLGIGYTIMIVTFFSLELGHIYVILRYPAERLQSLELQYAKAGLTVVWAICSFALMWLGMKHREKMLRIISLVMFSVVLLKLFIFDISNVSEGGRILAFILLGVLLLTVSFMYQRLKKILLDDKKE